MSESPANPSGSGSLSGNPFVVESPEKLSPEQTVSLFVKDYTRLETVRQRRHTFVWGSRGSGKSMMLRFLEPQCQAIAEGSHDAVFRQRDAFLAVYCPCKEGHFNKSELEHIDEDSSAVLSEHLLNISIAYNVIFCLNEQFPAEYFELAECSKLAMSVSRLFDPASIAGSAKEAKELADVKSEPFTWLEQLLSAEIRKISSFLRERCLKGSRANYKGATSGYHDFLLPFLKIVGGLRRLGKASIYVLIDDADRLTKHQQSIVNNWIANRDQATLCVKVSAQRESYKTFFTPRGGLIEQPHDFSEVDVEELYTTKKTDYYKKIALISQRRLILSDVPTKEIEKFLPASESEEKLFEQVREETAKEWETRKRQDKSDYVYRYAKARLFQKLKARKIDKSYAGFQNLVDLSSGIVREFLEPCYLMFDTLVAQGKDAADIAEIPVELQNRVINKYSKDVLIDRIEDIKKDMPSPGSSLPDKLRALVESLGLTFYNLLHDPDSKQPRLFSFLITGPVPGELGDVLDLGVRYRFFLAPTSQGGKSGGGQNPLYILNRRLCPAYKLDPSGFEGRLTISPDLLRIACEDPRRFVRLRLKDDPEAGKLPLFEDEEDAAEAGQ
ncbi:ORC-CDC6 family AAA ATPase [Aquisphaera insulae]|uniref:ORC-CDC6 family AAA ATPase n=1 Tax=Aquisphaera insulae TaxID=2712864 RepID=UPI0013EB0429|nr:hypothetical protein [Aquisphaera insulae]